MFQIKNYGFISNYFLFIKYSDHETLISIFISKMLNTFKKIQYKIK